LSSYIKDNSEGVDLLGTKFHMSLYADDGKAPCSGRENAVRMADLTATWARDWKQTLSPGKSKTAFTYHDGTGIIPASLPPLNCTLAGPIPYTESYIHLGIANSGTLDLDTAFEHRAVAQCMGLLNKRHRSKLFLGMPPAQQFQIAKTFLGAYASELASIAPEATKTGDARRCTVLRAIVGASKITSHLLLFTMGGFLTERAIRLQSRYRQYQYFKCHPQQLRYTPGGIQLPPHNAISLFNSLVTEDMTQGYTGKYNWVTETRMGSTSFAHLLPLTAEGAIDSALHPHQCPILSRRYGQAVAYLDGKKRLALADWSGHDGILSTPPRSDGSTKSAGFITCYMTAPDAEFTRPQGTGMGTLGPGLPNPYSICSIPGVNLLSLARAQMGNIALRLHPWGDGFEGDDPDDHAPTATPKPNAKRQTKAKPVPKRKTTPRKRRAAEQESLAEEDTDSDADACPPLRPATPTSSPKAKRKRKPLYGTDSPSEDEEEDDEDYTPLPTRRNRNHAAADPSLSSEGEDEEESVPPPKKRKAKTKKGGGEKIIQRRAVVGVGVEFERLVSRGGR
jgi:hypothetical protein